MSDFLSNLAARVLTPAGVVRPRLPSRFEPLPVVGPELGSLFDESAHEAVEADERPEPHRAPARSRPEAGLQRREPSDPERFASDEPAPGPTKRVSLAPGPVHRLAASPEEAAPEDGLPGPPASHRPIPALSAPHRLAAAARKPPEASHLSPAPEPPPGEGLPPEHSHPSRLREPSQAPIDPRPSVPPPLFRPAVGLAARGPADEPARAVRADAKGTDEARSEAASARPKNITEPDPVGVSPPRPVSTPLRITPVVAPVPVPAQRRAPAPTPLRATATTIEVSIGRIEVKASLPPAATPRAPKSRGLVMSLDDYLQGREKGGAS